MVATAPSISRDGLCHAGQAVPGNPGAGEERETGREAAQRGGAAGAGVDDPAGEGEPGAAEAGEQVGEADEAPALRGAGEVDELGRGGDVGQAPAEAEPEQAQAHPGDRREPG